MLFRVAIISPGFDAFVALNREILEKYPVKRGDRHDVMSPLKVVGLAQKVETTPGDLYDKATVLLSSSIGAHAFASGNKRTAFFMTRAFLELNAGAFAVGDLSEDDGERNRKTLTGIREGFYTHEEIKRWLQDGTIKDFERG